MHRPTLQAMAAANEPETDSKLRRSATAVILLGALIGVAACGPTGLETATEQAEIVEAITESLVSSDPAHCADLYTQSLMDQLSDGLGEEAVRDCLRNESDRDAADAQRVEVSAPALTTDTRATATARVIGGDYDQATLELRLVKVDSAWRLDRLEDVEFDRPAFDRALQASAIRDGLEPRQARCLVRVTRKQVETDELEAAMLGFEEPGGNVGLRCYGVDDIRSEMIEEVRAVEKTREIPPGVIDCMEMTMRRLPAEQIRSLSQMRSEERTEAALARLWRACARQAPETSSS
jgi:hypothetical protein